MAELNKIMLIGRLTKDPELRYTPSGTAVAKLRMAVNHTYRVKEEKKEEVLYIDVSVFGRSAETVKQYTSKGRELFIEGRLKQDEWTDKQTNQKRISYGVIADRFQFLGSGSGRPATGDAPAEESGPPTDSFDGGEAPVRNQAPPAEKEDDLPF
jgi:single-strand DNA-binding protein